MTRRQQAIRVTDPSVMPPNNRSVRNIAFLSPGRYGLGHAINGQHDAVSAVPHVLGMSGPLAVTGLVVPVVVNPIELSPLRLLAHVFQEILKKLPSLADRDTSPSIPFVITSSRILAAVLHLLPGTIARDFLSFHAQEYRP